MLIGKKCILRGLELSDADVLHKLMNNWEVLQFLTYFKPLSKEDVIEMIRLAMQQMKNLKSITFAIVDKEDQTLIGVTSLHNIDWKNRHAEFGIVIWNPNYWDKGIGTDVARVLLHYAFSELNFHRIEIRLLEYNKRIIRLSEKLGFKLEGILRDYLWRNGRWYNLMIMSILDNEFYVENLEKIKELELISKSNQIDDKTKALITA